MDFVLLTAQVFKWLGPGTRGSMNENSKYDRVEATHGRVGLYGFKISMRVFCIAVAVVHLILAITFGALRFLNSDDSNVPKHLLMPVTKSLGAWLNRSDAVNYPTPIGSKLKSECSLATARDSRSPEYYIQPISLYVTTYDTRWAIILFHFLSFAFQLCNSIWSEQYNQTFKNGQTHLSHFLEYSISASIMITTMTIQLGVHDVYTLIGVFCNSWACMIFGFLAQVFHHNNTPKINILYIDWSPHWIAHFSGWVTLIIAITAVVSSLGTFLTCMNEFKLPNFVIPLIIVEMLFFSSFGFIQMLEFIFKPEFDKSANTDSDTQYENRVIWAFRTEFWYILLSLSAKSVLGFVVYFAS